MNITKKIAAYFLLAIFLFNTMGYFIAFQAMQFQIKSHVISEINLGIKTDAETIITINKNDISKIDWEESGKEMVYNNKRYDIVKSTENNNSITYYCINDTQEETLYSNLDEHINMHIATNKPTTSHSSKNLVNDVVKIFFANQYQFSFTNKATSVCFLPFRVNYTSESITTNSPPPQFV